MSTSDPLILAARNGDIRELRQLLKKGHDPNAKDGDGLYALRQAVVRVRYGCAKLLLQHGAKVDLRGKAGATSLGRASDARLARLLIDHGADVNAKDAPGRCPLFWAIEHSIGVVRVLLERGANPNLPDNNGITPLMYAARLNKTAAFAALCAAGADLSLTDNHGRVAIEYACGRDVRCWIAKALRERQAVLAAT